MTPEPSEKKIDRVLVAVGAVGLVAVCGHIFFSSGHTYSLDGAAHSAKSMMVYQSLVEGDFPVWSNLWHTGYPLLQFYPPLFHFLAGCLNLLFNNLIFTIKALSFTAQILSGITAFLLVKEITDSPRAGLIAALVNALSPWHVFLIVSFNRFPHNFIYAFLPLLFYFYERYRKGKESFWRTAILEGFTFALLFAFQYGYVLFVTYFFVLYLLLDNFSFSNPGVIANNGKLILATGVVAAGLALFLLLPFITADKQELSGMNRHHDVWEFEGFQLDSADFETLYTRRGNPVGHKGYIGLGFAVLSLFGVVEAFRRRRFVLIILYGFSLFLILGHETGFYRYIPFVYSQKGTERLIIYHQLFMAVLAGLGWELIGGFLRSLKRFPYLPVNGFILLMALLVWDVSVMFNLKWSSSYYGLKPVYQSLKGDMEKGDKNYGRVLHLFKGTGSDWISDKILCALQVLTTPAPDLRGYSVILGLSRSWDFIEGGLDWVQDELEREKALRKSLDFLYLTDTAYIILAGYKKNLNIVKLSPHSPVVASGNLVFENNKGKNPEIFCRTIIPKMGVNKKTATARTLFSKKAFPDYRSLPPPEIKLLEYRQTINRTHLKVQSKTDTYLRISHAYYRYLSFTLDGKPIPFYPSSMEFILIRFPAGSHTIEISPVLSLLRKGTLFFSAAFMVLCLGGFFYLKKRGPSS